MVLFTIACETCASRLHVKQQAAIGQVLACPKCGSMVHVRPPEGWEMPESPDAPPRQPKLPRDPDDSQATLSGEFGNIRDEVPPTRPLNQKAKPEQAATPQAPAAAAPPVQETVNAVPANHWEADGSNQRGKALAWIAGIIGICLAALVLILYMVSRMIGNGENPEIAKSETEKTEVVADKDDTEKQPADDDSKQPSHEEDNKEKGTAAEVEAANENPDNNRPDNDDADKNQLPEDPGNSTDDPVLDEDAALTASGDSITMEQDLDNRSMLDEFSGIGELVLNPGIDMEEFREATSDDQTHKYGIGKVYVPVPRALKVDPLNAVEEVYPGLAYTGQPLIEFTRNLISLTQVPIQLDSRAIIEGRLDPRASINASGKEVTPAQILGVALEPLDLVWQWNADNTVIIITPKPSSEIVASEILLDPVLAIADDETAQKLIDGIQLVIEPMSWNVNAGLGTIKFTDGKLVLEQQSAITRQVESLVGKLTTAARLKSNPADTNLAEQLASVYARTRDLRNSEGEVHSLQLLPIGQLLNQLDREDGLTLIVNWSEARTENWNPNVTIPWLSSGQSIETTLRDLTNSMGLAYRLLDEGTLEITSKQEFKSATRLEVYPCNRQLQKRFTGNQIIEFLKEGIVADLPQGGHTPVVFSPNYNCIVAVLPDPLHIKVERILNQLAERE